MSKSLDPNVHVQKSSAFPDAIIEVKNGGVEPARPQHQLDGAHHGARRGGTRGNTRDATQQPSWARGHHPLHQVREYKNTWEHVTQHSSPHGHGDTIPSIRSESNTWEHT
jgi:hypothetical protein